MREIHRMFLNARKAAPLEERERLDDLRLRPAGHAREQRGRRRAAQRRCPGEQGLQRLVERVDAILECVEQTAAERRPTLRDRARNLQ